MNTPSLNRRRFLLTALSLPLVGARTSVAQAKAADSATGRLAKLEKELDGRLGVFALDTGDGRQLRYRAGERFPFCSTFKALVAAAILHRSQSDPNLLARRIVYNRSQLAVHSPIAEQHVGTGMAVADLCAATVQYSDNTAANLLLELLGGLAALTAFARSLGDRAFRLDRWEPELNTAIPGDPRDTTTPEAMGRNFDRLLLGDALEPSPRALLRDWMLGNTTGNARIRAGVPAGWRVADKTGTGDHGTANDIAVLWPDPRAPVVLTIYTTRRAPTAKARDDIVAAAARVVADWLAEPPGAGSPSHP